MHRFLTPHKLIPRTGVSLATLLMVSSLSGCYSEGGMGWSEDQHVFVSRPQQPWTVSLKDTRTGQDVWSVEVPVGKQLVVHFLPKAGAPNSFTPDLMEWGLMDAGTEFERLGNTLPVPPADSRRFDPVLRPVPEFPPGMVAPSSTVSGGEK